MGEVYKARDTCLDRTVAIKVLPDHIAQREDIRARFEREALAVASLNHPNICDGMRIEALEKRFAPQCKLTLPVRVPITGTD